MPDFKNADGTSRVATNVIANPGATRAGDEVGHGTHVAGIIAGNSFNRAAPTRRAARYVGIAPEADLIAIKTADDAGNSTVLDVINALQFVVDHKDELNIRVVNLSVSSDTPGSYLDDPLDAAVEFAWHAGIVVVAAAGNRGDAADAVQYAPGNDPYVISVGATDEVDTADPRRRHARGVLEPRRHARTASPSRTSSPRAPASSPRWPMGSAFQQLVPATCVVGRPVPAHRRHLDGRPGRRRRRGAAAPGPPGAQPGPGQGAADGRTSTRPPTAHAGSTSPTALGRRRSAAGANAGPRCPNPIVKAALLAGRHRPDARHLDHARPGPRATWTRATWTGATWTTATWTGDAAGATPRGRRATWTLHGLPAARAGVDRRPDPVHLEPLAPGAVSTWSPQHVVERRMVTSTSAPPGAASSTPETCRPRAAFGPLAAR